MKILVFAMALGTLGVQAWEDKWAPPVRSEPAGMLKLSREQIKRYVMEHSELGEGPAIYAEGAALDLNDDGICDFVYVVPWMGCGLNADGYDVHFIVSDDVGGMREMILPSFGAGLSDLVKVDGRTYFRHSAFFESFEKSRHNHWVFQFFSFARNGEMIVARDVAGVNFPAVTIFYEKPKFKQIELTEKDREKIRAGTRPKVVKRQTTSTQEL